MRHAQVKADFAAALDKLHGQMRAVLRKLPAPLQPAALGAAVVADAALDVFALPLLLALGWADRLKSAIGLLRSSGHCPGQAPQVLALMRSAAAALMELFMQGLRHMSEAGTTIRHDALMAACSAAKALCELVLLEANALTRPWASASAACRWSATVQALQVTAALQFCSHPGRR